MGTNILSTEQITTTKKEQKRISIRGTNYDDIEGATNLASLKQNVNK
jgi:hypothetical protein